MHRALPSGVGRLPADERAILVLRDVLGWELDDVADLLDMRADVVNGALVRARAALEGAERQGFGAAEAPPSAGSGRQ